ncbi:MAG: restriction endonuclease [Bacteroidia bacterium]|jgi:type II restriction enzyme|nr:restriction endonuclease [Bacteroidia bacterium]
MKFPPKSDHIRFLLNQAIDILFSLGIPIKETSIRQQDRIAMAFLAVANVTGKWKNAQSLKDGRKITSREIIGFMNQYFEENLSKGSYDDIRDVSLKYLVLTDLIINSGDNPSAKQNDPTRGYSLDNDFRDLIRTYGTNNWEDNLSKFLLLKGSLIDRLNKPRKSEKYPVTLPNNIVVEFSNSFHNILQKAIIEEFLPNFGFGCAVLYIGDASNRILHHDPSALQKISFFEIGSGKLPDIIAYSSEKNWLFLIEAVTTSGPMSDERVLELNKLAQNCTAELIFVTAFLNKSDFRKHAANIGWETEVWIADRPTHMIHYNGDKFLGPYKP